MAKVGLSFSRCVLDIVENRVDINDVLVVISRTDFDPRNDTQWMGIWKGYTGWGGMSNPEWAHHADVEGAEDRFRSVTIELWETGKLHQPRQFGAYPTRRPEFWLETVLVSEEIETNPAVKSAWNNFQVIAGLTNTKLDTSYQ
jgi:hypothetical protein